MNMYNKKISPDITVTTTPNKLQNKAIVFIDDDEIIRTCWIFAAEEAGINITTYSSPAEFYNEISTYIKDTVIYIDSNLGNGVKGELHAKELYALGFTEIYLATGYPSEHFSNMPWIKLVVGKEPPFYYFKKT